MKSAATSTETTGTFIGLNVGLNLTISGSLHQVWSMLNALQIITHAPMYGELKFPPKASILNGAFIDIANFKWLDTWEKLDLEFLYFPEDEPFHNNFK